MRTPTKVVLGLAALQIAAVPPPIPVEKFPPPPPPAVAAPAWILYDETNELMLDGVAVDAPRPMASTTKIMTGLLAIESGRLDEIVTVSQRAADIGEAEIGLEVGERIPMAMLVHALLMRSGNDAAMAVAEHLGGTVEGFVQQMNLRAAELGLTSTAFTNPHGLDADGHHSSPRDLMTLGQAAMAVPEFAEIVGLTRYRIADAPDGTARVAETTNDLLTTYRGTFGVKTGSTFQAGLVFVGGAERDGRRLWVVVMGSEGPRAHFSDATILLDHGFEAHRMVDTIRRGSPFRLAASRVDTELAALTRLHTLTLLHSIATPPITLVTEEPVTAEPDVLTADLPGPLEALGWLFGAVLDG